MRFEPDSISFKYKFKCICQTGFNRTVFWTSFEPYGIWKCGRWKSCQTGLNQIMYEHCTNQFKSNYNAFTKYYVRPARNYTKPVTILFSHLENDRDVSAYSGWRRLSSPVQRVCVISLVQKGTQGLTHKGWVLQWLSLGTLSDVTVILWDDTKYIIFNQI